MTMFSELVQRRARLAAAGDAIAGTLRDIQNAGREGSEAAGIAACWAAVMMATGIVKTGLSISNKTAAAGFGAIDSAISSANRVLTELQMPTIATKGDVMKAVDPNLQGAAGFIRSVNEARAFLKKAGANPPPHVKLMLDLATQMAEDTLLMLQAGQTQAVVNRNTQLAMRQVVTRLQAMRQKILLLDGQIAWLLSQHDLYKHTA